ncbi:MAG TPA: hypothetical protein VNR37_00785 [Microbacteriaceae bacterium]|nr:hypothetical protein [Microbacteriaceae bacterium]
MSDGAGDPAKAAAGSKAKVGASALAKFPRHTVEQALRIPEAILQQNAGNPATPAEAVVYSGGTKVSGRWNVEISSAKKYGFLKADGTKLVVEERARKAISPQSESDRRDALRDAVLSAPDLAEVYKYYRGEALPDEPFLVNALTDRFGIPADQVPEFLDIFMKSLRSAGLLDESGSQTRLLDAGRETSSGAPAPPGKKSVKSAATGTTCFVMQPFAAPLGGYYDLIFRPAIEQAGLTAVRADAEIFGTGKIIDQIWRGIQDAEILLAELTTKNPNVFYELGLAHAIEKPVILISSNEDDVPFDLRHIRVILYDRSDPFWGQKLIDNIADKITSARERPEEAIFKLPERQ